MILKTTKKFIALALMLVLIMAGCKSKKYTDLPDFLDVYPYNGATFTTQEVQELDGIVVEVNNWLIEEKEIDGDTLLMHSTLFINGKTISNEMARWVQFRGVSFSLVWEMPLPEGKYAVTYLLVDDTGFTHEYSWDFEIVTASETDSPPIIISPTLPIFTLPGPASPTPTFSATPIPLTPTVESTSTPPPNPIIKKCLIVANQVPENMDSAGVAVLSNTHEDLTYLFNFSTGLETALIQGYKHDLVYSVSPDRKWLAYRIWNTQKRDLEDPLFLTNANGEVQQHILLYQEWWSLDWINNETLLIGPNAWDEQELLPMTLLNPFSGEWQNISPELPPLFFFPGEVLHTWGNYVYYSAVIDPSMTRIIFPKWESPYEVFPITLWDLDTNIELGRINTTDLFGKWPQWSPDGQWASFITDLRHDDREHFQQELFALNKVGEPKRLTYLSDQFESVAITTQSWSPDGTKIAFWVSLDENNPIADPNKQLFVIDLFTGMVTNYCNFGDHSQSGIIWSPNSKQLLVTASNLSNQQSPSIILLDIANEWASVFLNDALPVGWMDAP
ncbi:MAG: PD40 domain-containing protein [Anaerolineales bacterium]|nr:PD40 domain-containing protein [Anaerolineales bacterium]